MVNYPTNQFLMIFLKIPHDKKKITETEYIAEFVLFDK
jgi:hypothetical protein